MALTLINFLNFGSLALKISLTGAFYLVSFMVLHIGVFCFNFPFIFEIMNCSLLLVFNCLAALMN